MTTILAWPNIDKYLYPHFCIDMNISALFYRYIDIVDNDDSSISRPKLAPAWDTDLDFV